MYNLNIIKKNLVQNQNQVKLTAFLNCTVVIK